MSELRDACLRFARFCLGTRAALRVKSDGWGSFALLSTFRFVGVDECTQVVRFSSNTSRRPCSFVISNLCASRRSHSCARFCVLRFMRLPELWYDDFESPFAVAVDLRWEPSRAGKVRSLICSPVCALRLMLSGCGRFESPSYASRQIHALSSTPSIRALAGVLNQWLRVSLEVILHKN